ncbi:MAG: SpoIID/LytB domain-containing protein [Flavobacteriales bacterium]|nr:SpoIID/LytB domain-containing protein [Flavobacteriales bacterium]
MSILFTFNTLSILTQDVPVHIRLFSQQKATKVTVTVKHEQLELVCDSLSSFTMLPGDVADITATTHGLSVWYKGKAYKYCEKVSFISRHDRTAYRIQVHGNKPTTRLYEGDLEIEEQEGYLFLLNVLNLERYVGGVVEAEAGSEHTLEYYKVQAVISRTYALNNMRRHAPEGYHLCDGTHCQVYHGAPRHTDLAEAAAWMTRDIVVVDPSMHLITAVFHSNCGGRTVNAEQVWSKPESYLVSCTDSFCVAMPNARWEKSFSKTYWENYLKSHVMEAPQPEAEIRQIMRLDSVRAVPLVPLRQDLKLRSTAFDVRVEGEEVKLMGRGFGHGVGLCQEGAINMARLGYSYSEIIHYYYKDVHLVPRKMLWFFED